METEAVSHRAGKLPSFIGRSPWKFVSLTAALALGALAGLWYSRQQWVGGAGQLAGPSKGTSRTLLRAAEVSSLFRALSQAGLTEDGKFKIEQFVRERADRVLGVAVVNPRGWTSYAYPNSEALKGVLFVLNQPGGKVKINGKAVLGDWYATNWGTVHVRSWKDAKNGFNRMGVVLERKTSGADAFTYYNRAEASYRAGHPEAAVSLIRKALDGSIILRDPPYPQFAVLRELARRNADYALALARRKRGSQALEVNQLTLETGMQLKSFTLIGGNRDIADLVATALFKLRDDTLRKLWDINAANKTPVNKTTTRLSPNPPAGKG